MNTKQPATQKTTTDKKSPPANSKAAVQSAAEWLPDSLSSREVMAGLSGLPGTRPLRQSAVLQAQSHRGNAHVQRLLAQANTPILVSHSTPHTQPGFDTRVVQRFGSEEHRQLGAAGSGGATTDIDLGDDTTLTYGEMVALAGDYFQSIEEMRSLAANPAGQEELRWARWKALGGSEPTVSQTAKDNVMDRYYRLAANNISHFSAGGTARSEYQRVHTQALHQAFMAGVNENLAKWSEAVTTEAFSNHYLTDMFAAGHVRTPRAAIKQWYQENYANSVNQFVGYAADRMTASLDSMGDIPWYWPNSSVSGRLEARIRALGGSAIDSYSLGDVVSLAYHDQDNVGLGVISDVDPQGNEVAGGYQWTATGDSHLADSPITRQMAEAAVRTSLNDLETLRVMGQQVGANQCLPEAELENQFLLALASIQPFAAEKYVPREDTSANNAQMRWQWGDIDPILRASIDQVVKGEIASSLRGKSEAVPEVMRFTRRGREDPDGAVTLHVRQAFFAFCDQLAGEGIVAIEDAMNRSASPPSEEVLDAGVPLPAGVPEDAADAGVPAPAGAY